MSLYLFVYFKAHFFNQKTPHAVIVHANNSSEHALDQSFGTVSPLNSFCLKSCVMQKANDASACVQK
jgi:hypothetical protein